LTISDDEEESEQDNLEEKEIIRMNILNRKKNRG
jgi:hypothetical protein